MSFHDLLQGGHSFLADEENLAFRIRLLNGIMMVAVVFSVVFIALDRSGVNALGTLQTYFTLLLAAVSGVMLWYLRGRKRAFKVCACVFVVMAFMVFSSALLLVLDDELRVIWFYILVVWTYLLLGQRYGVAATLASTAMVAIAKFGAGIPFSGNAFATFVLSLCATSGITWAYTHLSDSYFERMTNNLRRMEDLASRDPLTGLWNGRSFYAMADKLLQVAQRNSTPFCILFIDLDHFKSVNDQYGHEMGDAVLRVIAECIGRNVRESDVVGRIGGEEFVVFLPNTQAQGGVQLAEKLCVAAQALQHPFSQTDHRSVTLSIGVAQYTMGDGSVTDVQKRADSAMYTAKQQGRNRVALAS